MQPVRATPLKPLYYLARQYPWLDTSPQPLSPVPIDLQAGLDRLSAQVSSLEARVKALENHPSASLLKRFSKGSRTKS